MVRIKSTVFRTGEIMGRLRESEKDSLFPLGWVTVVSKKSPLAWILDLGFGGLFVSREISQRVAVRKVCGGF